jgi:hypothetical protein
MMKTVMKLKKKVKEANKMMKWMLNKVLDHQAMSPILLAE